MQIAYVDVPSEWTKLSDLIATALGYAEGETYVWEVGKTYTIEARGQGDVLLIESDTLPSGATVATAGIQLDYESKKSVKYIVGSQTIYCKLVRQVSTSSLNIAMEG